MPNRMLIRRTLALLIDWVLVALFTTLFLYPFVRGHTDQIRFSSSIYKIACKRVTTAPIELVQFIKNETLSDLIICQKKPLFVFDNGLTAKLVYNNTVRKNGNVTVKTSKTFTLDIDDNGMPIDVAAPQGFLNLALLISISAFFLIAKQGRTPGKYILGLRVENITRHRAIRREFWRFAPLIPLTLILALPNSILRIPLQDGWMLAGLLIAIMGFTAWYYIYPMVRWTGALRHDKIAGTHVERG